jgi:hypothetical protein
MALFFHDLSFAVCGDMKKASPGRGFALQAFSFVLVVGCSENACDK